MEETFEDMGENMNVFTLEDTYENLKDVREELIQEIDELINHTVNNEFDTLAENVRQEEIKKRYHKLMPGLLGNLHRQEPRVLPHAKTIDLQKTIVQDFTNVIDDMNKFSSSTKIDSEETKKNIACLKSNKAGLQKMTIACQGAIENVRSDTTYRKEIAITKRIFNEVKANLFTCVDTIFPDNLGFKDLLASLTQAYTRGGDDVYIDVEPESLVFVKFLIEADLAVYHRNDKTKIKMTDLL